ncbi:uncharacterized protein [Cicer arietinum]|uniref:Uncharacterized protein LOC101510335 isoform X2 n=1 Tax=Cicer arietinum TaxID=3827 RepID=A0A1S3EH86_CICAR|nr:uncharacterized protein LOC101510335 isoform X2 [Cicer arietinum]
MSCPKEEALLKLFNNVSTSFQLPFLLLFFSAVFLVTFLTFTGRFPLIQRDKKYEYVFSDDEEEEEEEESEEEYSCVDSYEGQDIKCGRDTLLFMNKEEHLSSYSEEFISPRESFVEENETLSIHNSPQVSDFENQQHFQSRDFVDSVQNYAQFESSPTSINLNLYKNYNDDEVGMIKNKKVQEASKRRDERLFVFASKQLKSKKLIVDEEKAIDDSFSEWRSSIHCMDSGTEDDDALSSTSSTRSCPKWESYTLFQTYDDQENAFLDRINSQNKLHETACLGSIQMSPRSISERIANKFSSINKKPSDLSYNQYYNELEAAYVAQICLTWEALSWNYKTICSKHVSQSCRDLDIGCPATIAQQFQQFQVLLQRYIENEPYENGRRPEIYARMRLLAPKLLLVPEYQEDGQKDSDFDTKISSASFLKIMEGGIRTFMNFLKTDKKKSCQILKYYFKRNRRGMVDPTLLNLMKKVNQKKRMKIKDIFHSGKGLRKIKLKSEEEMEILMALIDLKVVSRVLRMKELNEKQLNWCEKKMSKVRVVEGKLCRDYSTPLFLPLTLNSVEIQE